MTDFSSITVKGNKGSDASPDFTGAALTPGGSGGAMEMRLASSGGAQTITTPSNAWPLTQKPLSGTGFWDELYLFNTNITGYKTIYDGTNSVARVLQFAFSGDGTPASAMQFSMFDSSSHPTPSPGTQPSLINGSTNTSNKSCFKANAYGPGAGTAGSVQFTPAAGSVGSAPTATSGSAGAAITATTGLWATNWQDLQGWSNYIQGGHTVQALFAFSWYFTLAVFFASDISASTFLPVLTLQYTYS